MVSNHLSARQVIDSMWAVVLCRGLVPQGGQIRTRKWRIRRGNSLQVLTGRELILGGMADYSKDPLSVRDLPDWTATRTSPRAVGERKRAGARIARPTDNPVRVRGSRRGRG